MASKRPAPQDSPGVSSSAPSTKKVHFEPFRIGQVSTLEEMDMKTLQFQNRKLAQRLDQRIRQESELRARVEQLEKRQTSDEGVLTVVNRYWNQLNEDLRVLLQRFDSEAWDESEQRNEAEATTSFLGMLLHWDREELDEKLAQRVQVSTRAVAKLLQAFDRLVQRNHKVMLALQGEEPPGPDGEPAMDSGPVPDLNEAVRQANIELQTENKNLHALVTSLHEKNHKLSLKFSEHQDQVDSMQTKNDELRNRVEELEYELSKVRAREEKLDCHLADCLQRIKSFQVDGCDTVPTAGSSGGSGGGSVSNLRLEDLQSQLEEQRELASARLLELEQLQHDHKEALKTVERLRLELRSLPESLVVSTAEYKCLQSQFSVLYNESMQLRTQLDECRASMTSSKSHHMRQIEQMESDELAAQKKLRSDVIRLEDNIAQIRREYKNLRIEFESSSVSSEQAQPINREMRHIITSLQSHNRQLKSEVSRNKRKLREAQSETQKLRQMLEMSNVAVTSASAPPSAPSSSGEGGSTRSDDAPMTPMSSGASTSTVGSGGSAGGSGAGGGRSGEDTPVSRHEEDCRAEEEPIPEREKGKSDADIIRDLKAQLKKSQEAQRELKLLLDMYKGAPKEQRDKVQLMAAEKKARAEAEEHRQQLKKLVEHERKERRKLADEDAMKKIRALEETVNNLHKSLAAQKQEEEALLSEMEVTGQAFEDMQEQNLRLLQQLREKDDANFKLMSERIKSTQVHKLLQDEKVALMEQAARLQDQVEAQNQVVRKLEEKERLLQNSLSTVEKELSLRQQAAEVHRRKAVESAQSAADLKLHLEKYLAQLRDAQSIVTDRTAVLSQETFKTKRLQEEILSLRRKVERAKKFELATNTDEVLMEEIKEYKEQLTCPSCKVKRKDAVLIKCFHVFCYDCLKTRYETRQRKCPKCNAPFGTNDYHRLYLT
uniref:E3 ubiquitin protein ligase n=1 Tax=Rhipicephalus appendiculatus TaxID=34631 RepID=A0A131YMN0_RHIAP